MNSRYSPLRHRGVAVLVVAILAVAVYANSLGNGFAYDDAHIIQGNEAIQSMETLPGALVSPYWPGDYGRELGLWRPVTTLTIGLTWVATDGSRFAYHALNVVLHAAVSGLVVLLMAELLTLPTALLAGLLFAVHPVHVEAVANVIGVAELLAALAVVSASLVHVRGGDRTGWPRALGIGVLYAVAFGAKESAVTFAGLVFLLDAARERLAFADLRDYLARRWRLYLTLVVVAAHMLLYRWVILGSLADPLAPLGASLLTEVPRIWTLGEVWSHYARLWVMPLDLSIEYAPLLIPIRLRWMASNLVGVLLTLTILVVALIAWRSGPLRRDADSPRAAAFGVVWFIIVISPISNVLFLAGVLLAERTLYLPTVGLAGATAWLLMRLAETRRGVAVAVTLAALVLGAWKTWDRNPSWHDNQTMFNTLIEELPQSGRSQWVMGDVLLGRGEDTEALWSYRVAIGILGPDYILLTEVAKRLVDNEYLRAAEHLANTAWREAPHYPVAQSMLAIIHSERGEAEAAERMARLAITIAEVDPYQTTILAWSLVVRGRLEEARALQGDGFLPEAWQSGVVEAYLAHAEGDIAAAQLHLERARRWATLATGRARVDEAAALLLGYP